MFEATKKKISLETERFMTVAPELFGNTSKALYVPFYLAYLLNLVEHVSPLACAGGRISSGGSGTKRSTMAGRLKKGARLMASPKTFPDKVGQN